MQSFVNSAWLRTFSHCFSLKCYFLRHLFLFIYLLIYCLIYLFICRFDALSVSSCLCIYFIFICIYLLIYFLIYLFLLFNYVFDLFISILAWLRIVIKKRCLFQTAFAVSSRICLLTFMKFPRLHSHSRIRPRHNE